MASSLLDNVVLFGRLLRRAGLRVSPGRLLDFARSLELVDLADRRRVFCAARALLVSRREDLALFELLFDRFWRAPPPGGAERPPAAPEPAFPAAAPPPGELPRSPPRGAGDEEPELEGDDRSATYSAREVLRRKELAAMDERELEEVKRMIRDLRWEISRRRSRRLVADRRGSRPHLRRLLRDAAKYDGTPIRLRRLSRKIKQRQVVLLADVSGSMERYSRLLLQFFWGATHGLGDVECFVFGTRLTRITPQLRIRNVDRALAEAAEEIVDWSGGTRIGESLARFNRHWGRRLLHRGAVAVIVSDGWERGDVDVLRREMRRLHHRCHRLLWLNPHLGHPGYEPLVAGMAAALPFVDDFLPVHDLDSLERVAEVLGAVGR